MKKRNFSVLKHDEINNDLQEIVDYYNDKKAKLGNQFYKVALKQMRSLSNDFLLYEVKYQNVRCISVSGFPYMIHYTINEGNNTVLINAVIGMSQDPDTNWGKR